MDMTVIMSAISGFKSMTDIIKALNGLRVSSEVKSATMDLLDNVIKVQSSLLDAQSQQSAIIKEIDDLKKELMCIKAWEKEK